MKNTFLVLLCIALTACVIWGCTASGRADGLARENDALSRKYLVLQTLYTKTREEADSLLAARAEQESAAAAAAETPQPEAADPASAAPAAADILHLIMGLPVPEEAEEKEAAPAAPEISEEATIFTVPAPASSPEAAAPDAAEQPAGLSTESGEDLLPSPEEPAEAEELPEEILLDGDGEIPLG